MNNIHQKDVFGAAPVTSAEQAKLKKLYPDRGRLYTKFIQHESNDAFELAMQIKESLLNETTSLEQGTIDNLVKRSKIPENQLLPSVQLGRQALRDFFTSDATAISLKNNVWLVYGSLEFGDPRNLDADVLGVTSEIFTDTKQFLKVTTSIRDGIKDVWNTKKIHLSSNSDEPNFDIFSVKGDITNIPQLLENKLEYAFSYFQQAAIVITGKPLNDAGTYQSEELRNTVKKIIESDPLATAAVNCYLKDCFQERLRRKLQNNP